MDLGPGLTFGPKSTLSGFCETSAGWGWIMTVVLTVFRLFEAKDVPLYGETTKSGLRVFGPQIVPGHSGLKELTIPFFFSLFLVDFRGSQVALKDVQFENGIQKW